MNVTYTFGKKDEPYQEDIKNLVERMIPVVSEAFKEFDVTLDTVTYESHLDSTSVSFYSLAKKLYASIVVTMQPFSELTDKNPNEIVFGGVFAAGGISRELFHSMLSDLEKGPVVSFHSFSNGVTVEQRIVELFKKAEPDIKVWQDYMVASDIFLF